MISIETEARIAKFLLTLSDGEREIESIRQNLARQYTFDSFNIFRFFDKNLKNYIDEFDILSFLKPLNVICSLEDLKSILIFYDANADANLSYLEFINIIVTESDYTLRRISQEKTFTSTNNISYLSYEIEHSLMKLFVREIELVKTLTYLIKDLSLRYDYNPNNLFAEMDDLGNNYLSHETLHKFLIKNGVDISQSECAAIFKRLDIDRDNRVSLSEFNRVFSLSISGLNPVNSNFQGSIVQKTLNVVKSTTNNFVRNSPQKSNKNNYFSPLRDTNILNQSMSKSLNRSNELNNSNLRESTILTQLTRSKFSTYEEELFVEYLRETLIKEREIERLKSQLSMRSDFNLRDLFKIFVINSSSFLNISEIKMGFNLFNAYPSNDEIDLLIKRYDGTNVLNCFSFNTMLLPVDIEYNNQMNSRIGYDYHSKFGPEIFSFETRFIIENLFKAFVIAENSSEMWREKLFSNKSFEARTIFQKIDYYGKNYISSEDLIRYFNIHSILYNTNDLGLIFFIFDRNKDGRISFIEFTEELYPKSNEFLERNSLN